MAASMPRAQRTARPGEPIVYSIDGWYQAFSTPGIVMAMINTFRLAITRQAISLLIGAFFAWLIARTDIPMKGTLEFLFWLSFFLPALPETMGWILLLDRDRGGDPLDRRHLVAVGLDGEHRARLHAAPVEVDGARTAVGGVAADERPRLAELVAEVLDEEGSGFDVVGAGHSVDGDGDRLLCHGLDSTRSAAGSPVLVEAFPTPE